MPNPTVTQSGRIPRLVVLAVVPYLLLSASQDVKLTTVVNWDGSGLRQYTVSCLESRRRDVVPQLVERTRDFDRQRERWAGSATVITRDWRPADLAAGIPDSSLEMTGIIASPLNIFTYYRWSERVQIFRDTATEVERFGEKIASLRYELRMPGHVIEVTPTGQIQGGTVSWDLRADQPEYTVSAASRQVRWDYLLFALYIVGFIAFQIVHAAEHFIRNRPRRI